MRLITYSNEQCEGLDNFIQSSRYFGFEPIILGYGEKYIGHTQKLKAVYSFLSENEDDIYLFADGHDSLIVNPRFYVESEIYLQLKSGIVLMSAEKACNPYPVYTRIYPEAEHNSNFRYLNSGGWVAWRDDILRILDDISIFRYEDNINDQGTLSSYFLANPGKIKLDTNCNIFQCLYEVKQELDYNNCNRVYNCETGTYPCILHGNGRSDLSKALDYLKGVRK